MIKHYKNAEDQSQCFEFYLPENSLCVSGVSFVIDWRLMTAIIISVHTHTDYRHQGYATQLLKHTIQYLKRLNIESIELDDTTDHQRMPAKNIYSKLGWMYKYEWGPEMILKI